MISKCALFTLSAAQLNFTCNHPNVLLVVREGG